MSLRTSPYMRRFPPHHYIKSNFNFFFNGLKNAKASMKSHAKGYAICSIKKILHKRSKLPCVMDSFSEKKGNSCKKKNHYFDYQHFMA